MTESGQQPDSDAEIPSAKKNRTRPARVAAPERTALDRLRDLLADIPQRRFDRFVAARDPLSALKGRDPLLDDVIRLREIEGSRARLAEPHVFRRLLTGELRTPITRVRFLPSKSGKREED